MQPFESCPDCSTQRVSLRHSPAVRQDGRRDGGRRFNGRAASTGVPAEPAAAKSPSENLAKKLLPLALSRNNVKKSVSPGITGRSRPVADARGQQLANHASESRQPFFTKEQQELIEALYFGLYNPDWKDRIRKQLADDAGGYGKAQSIAMFGSPESGQFEFVMTGRHLTIRCDGHAAEHVAFGGPVFYGHAAHGFNEKPDHPDNIFWQQALKANALYQMLDGKHRKEALIAQAPQESEVQFRQRSQIAGLPATELSSDQKAHLKGVVEALIEPYRTSSRDEVLRCLNAQGGLDACRIAFFQSGDLGDDKVWDIWRLEGPSFVWHFRGSPHVHVWVNVADNPSVKITATG